MVEIEGERVLPRPASAAEGMVVVTNPTAPETARQMVVEMLVADQPAPDVAHDNLPPVGYGSDAGRKWSRFPKLSKVASRS
jgi:formate dehydrogenase major subunit